MSIPDRIRALEVALHGDPDAERRMSELIATLRHDLANLFGPFTMEAHLLGQLVPMLERATATGHTEEVRDGLAELKETSVNLADACDRARTFLAVLRCGSDEA